jgi:RHS repeat-associated protein
MSEEENIYNPIRYKGYYYDIETNMYYCKSRYYVPELFRWLNIDSIEYLDIQSINGNHLFMYCNNNPVMWMEEGN